ncbi:hypothetical protein MMC09_002845 [Bachmanniomyces sp. S44760]|nr:hypothetical protein [Bachmanniomyces sp. S44760]
MPHAQYMCVRSHQSTSSSPTVSGPPSSLAEEYLPQPNGHSLMATCPPFSHITTDPDTPYPHKMPDIPNADLMKLLQLSQSLPLDVGSGEITPIMALGIIRAHERYGELTRADFGVLMEGLGAKSRCYGFGAVLEEFEIRDALSSVFATKLETYL